MKKTCCVFNYGPLYRYPIYKEMAEQLDCDFFFGDRIEHAGIKQLDSNRLKNFKGYLKTKKLYKGYIWHGGSRPVFSKQYKNYIITGQPNILLYWLLIVYCKLTGRKIYAWTHGIRREKLRWDLRLRQYLFYKSLDGLFMYNRYMCDSTIEAGIDSKKLHVIYNSLDSHVQDEIYSTLRPSEIYHRHFGNTNPVIVFIGRIQRRMRLELIIDAIEQLKNQGTVVNAVFVGPEMEDYDLKPYAAKLKDQIWFYGPSYGEQQNSELLYNADVCVVPGSIGLTAIHSLSYGTPVITNDNFDMQMPEFEAIQDGITGSFFHENDMESLKAAICRWIHLAPSDRQRVRDNARMEISKNWNVDSQTELLRNTLN